VTVKELKEALEAHPDWLVVTDSHGNEITNLRPWVGDLRMEAQRVEF
jgi:hypothetical protein